MYEAHDLDIEPGLYRHFKGGHYVVLDIAKDVTNGRDLRYYVIYYGVESKRWYIRDLLEFNMNVNIEGGVTRRFSPCNP